MESVSVLFVLCVCVWVLVRDLTWRDLDLIVQRGPVPLYQKGPLDVALPLLYGVLLGFGGTLLAGVSVLLVIVHISSRNQLKPSPRGSPAAPAVSSVLEL